MKIIHSIIWLFILGNVSLFADYPTEEVDYNASIRDVTTDIRTLGNPVGSLEGQNSVGADGSFNYSIPIFTIPGTNGMQPDLKISYNSNQHDGILGLGWNLSGSSSISRIGKDKYHDGEISPVKFNAEDNFVLNGQRMVQVETEEIEFDDRTVNARIFALEKDNTIRIYERFFKYDTEVFEYFEVHTKEGMIIEYGGSLTANAHMYFENTSEEEPIPLTRQYFKSKIIDINGNYIKYNYDNNRNEYWLKSIRYTGNEQVPSIPYAQIRFEYGLRKDPKTSFFNGIEIPSTLLLTDICVEYTKGEDQLARKYHIDYQCKHFSQIKQITEFGKDEEHHYNPTVFKYSDHDKNYIQNQSPEYYVGNDEVPSSMLHTMVPIFNEENVVFYYGDFNNDGVKDRMVVEHDYDIGSSGNDRARWFLQTGYFYDPPSGTRQLKFRHTANVFQFESYDICDLSWFLQRENVIVADLNKDGYDDLIIPYLYSASPALDISGLSFAQRHQSLHIEVRLNDHTNHFSNPIANVNHYHYILKQDRIAPPYRHVRINEVLYPGDYDGDGYLELMLKTSQMDVAGNVLQGGGSGILNYYDLIDENGNFETDDLALDQLWENILIVDDEQFQLIPADFNQNGTTDILVINNDGGKEEQIYELGIDAQGKHKLNQIYNLGTMIPNETKRCFSGDFNADGKIDLLYRNHDDSKWCTRLWTGKEFTDTIHIPHMRGDHYDRCDNVANLYVADFDGDGTSDIWANLLFHYYDVYDAIYGGHNTVEGYQFDSRQQFDLVKNNTSATHYDNHSIKDETEIILFQGCKYNLNSTDNYIVTNRITYEKEIYSEDESIVCPYFILPERLAVDGRDGNSYNAYQASALNNDFNADGNGDLKHYNGNNYYLRLKSNIGKSKLNFVYDGYNNATKIQYDLLSNEFLLYGGSDAAYHTESVETGDFQNLKGGFYLVAALNFYKSDDLDISYQTNQYKYYDGVMHKEGLGFLGFKKIEKIFPDPILGTQKITEIYELDKTLVEMEQKEVTSHKDETLLSHESFTYNTVNLDNDRHIKQLESSTRIDKVNDLQKYTWSMYDNYNNLLYEITKVGAEGGTPEKIVEKDISYVLESEHPDNLWCRSLPEIITTTSSHSDDKVNPEFESQVKYYYSSGGMIDSIVNNNQNVSNRVTTEMTYDSFGNVIASKKAAYNDEDSYDVTISYLYDPETHRFIEEETNALNQTTVNEYDPLYGSLLTKTDIYGSSIYNSYDDMGFKYRTADDLGNITLNSISWATLEERSLSIKENDLSIYYISESKSYNDYDFDKVAGEVQNPLTSKVYFTSDGSEVRISTKAYNSANKYKTILVDKLYYVNGKPEMVSHPYYEDDVETDVLWNVYTYDPFTEKVETATTTDFVNTANDIVITTTYEPRKQIVTDARDRETTRETNASGDLKISIDQAGNEVEYFYHNNLKVEKIITVGLETAGAHELIIEYDVLGRKQSLNDPDYGVSTYTYNALGDILQEINPNGKIINIYDDYGRIYSAEYYDASPTSKLYQRIITTYNDVEFDIDDPNTYGWGEIKNIKEDLSNQELIFNYDYLGRVICQTETIDLLSINKKTIYNKFSGRIDSIIHPNNDTIVYLYDGRNTLNEKRIIHEDFTEDLPLWKLVNMDEAGNITRFERQGKFVDTMYFDKYGYKKYIKSEFNNQSNLVTLQEHKYNYDIVRNTMDTREVVGKYFETFNYGAPYSQDYKLDRLTSYSLEDYNAGKTNTITMEYLDDGSIEKKDGVGNYRYSDDNITPTQNQPHAIKSLTDSDEEFYHQTTTYTPFNSILTIEMCNKFGEFLYGIDGQRRRYIYYEDGVEKYRKYYFDNYEIIRYANNSETKTVLYESGNVIIKSDQVSNFSKFAINLNHQGSLTQIVDESGTITHEYDYDPWGRIRNVTDEYKFYSNYIVPEGFELFGRGFTGHEHMFEFGLINMNGRVYDPVLGQFIQPDNYVQFPEMAGSFNRYSYALNNPLMYTDPSGESLIGISTYALAMGLTYALYGIGREYYYSGVDAGNRAFLLSGTGYLLSFGVSAIAGEFFGEGLSSLSKGLIICGSSVVSDAIQAKVAGQAYTLTSLGFSLGHGLMNWGIAASVDAKNANPQQELRQKLTCRFYTPISEVANQLAPNGVEILLNYTVKNNGIYTGFDFVQSILHSSENVSSNISGVLKNDYAESGTWPFYNPSKTLLGHKYVPMIEPNTYTFYDKPRVNSKYINTTIPYKFEAIVSLVGFTKEGSLDIIESWTWGYEIVPYSLVEYSLGDFSSGWKYKLYDLKPWSPEASSSTKLANFHYGTIKGYNVPLGLPCFKNYIQPKSNIYENF